MLLKKYVVGLVLLFGLLTIGSLEGFAQSSTENQPIETAKALEVELRDDSFNPNTITLPKGESTTLLLKNTGNKEHTFTVEKLRIDVEVEPKSEKTITVKPDQPGTYELICRYHVQEGMVGKVIVQ
ncbi:cupredoxin domain-containing protein [Niallia sp. XMNu-256]|uniref:cupredoxin domain-containing protein n=1 Tax=Niallia sp. XMNu-256 TaxID=3082444 RepID=UPI0030CEE9A2